MATPNLNLNHITEGQSNKETTANAAFDGLDGAMNSVLEVAISGDTVLTSAQFRGSHLFRLTGAPGAAFTLTVPEDIARSFCISNETDGNAVIELLNATSDAISVNAGATAILHSDGEALYDIGGGTTAGSSNNNTPTLIIEDEGSEVATPSRLNFTGNGVSASENSDGTVDVTIEGAPATSITEETSDFELTDTHLGGNVILEVNNGSDVNLFIEAGLTGIEPVTVIQTGSGQVVVEEASGVSIKAAGGRRTRTQYSAISIIPHGSDGYYLVGDLAE